MTTASNQPAAYSPSIIVAVEAFCVEATSASNMCALFRVDEPFLEKVVKLVSLCVENGLTEAHVLHNVAWGFYGVETLIRGGDYCDDEEGDSTEIDNSELVVLPDGSFWFVAAVQGGNQYEAFSTSVAEVRAQMQNVVADELVALKADRAYPTIVYGSKAIGEVPQFDELYDFPPDERAVNKAMPYLVELNGVPHVLGNREFPYSAKSWDHEIFPDEAAVTAACLAYIEEIRARAKIGQVVFPLNTDDMPDRCVISVAIPFVSDNTLEDIRVCLADLCGDFKSIDQLYQQ